MKVFCVFGVSKSGKTTTIEKIIKELKKRGHGVASIKDIHSEEFSMDTPGTNTWRHMQAGSEMVVGRGMAETAVIINRRLEISELLKWFDHDFVVIEGGNSENFPKILTAGDIEEAIEKIDESVFAISGVVSEQNIELCGRPVINALTNVEKLVDIIENIPQYRCHISQNQQP